MIVARKGIVIPTIQLRPLGISETEPSSKALKETGPGPPYTYVADVQLGHFVGPEKLE